jgi:hypothetical protein
MVYCVNNGWICIINLNLSCLGNNCFLGDGICRWEVCLQNVQADGANSISLYVLKTWVAVSKTHLPYIMLAQCALDSCLFCYSEERNLLLENFWRIGKLFSECTRPMFTYVSIRYTHSDGAKCVTRFLHSNRIFCSRRLGVCVHKNLIKLMEVIGINCQKKYCLCGCKIKVSIYLTTKKHTTLK